MPKSTKIYLDPLDPEKGYFFKMNGQIRGLTENVVELRDACKSYGRGDDKIQVLKNFNMTIKKGSM